jgi:glycosyltransferase A (GT-A) superfamily protein (DUF2064 family)
MQSQIMEGVCGSTQQQQQQQQHQEHPGAIVVFAKCPIPGSSKTRLSMLVGDEGSAKVAKAMLSDILLTISKDDTRMSKSIMKFLVYAPGDENGEKMMMDLLSDLGLPHIPLSLNESSTAISDGNITKSIQIEKSSIQVQCDIDTIDAWYLLPMISSSNNSNDNEGQKESTMESNNNNHSELKSSDLGSKLSNALIRVRSITMAQHSNYNIHGPVAFLGMDAPELPMNELFSALTIAKSCKEMSSTGDGDDGGELVDIMPSCTTAQFPPGKAYINPAHDGGYGMICVPGHASPSIFEGVRWSSSLTAVSQLKALSDNGVDIVLGSLMNDIDETQDLLNLSVRLCIQHSSKGAHQINRGEELKNSDRLSNPSELFQGEELVVDDDEASLCPKTFEALLDLNLVRKKQRSNDRVRYKTVIEKFKFGEL